MNNNKKNSKVKKIILIIIALLFVFSLSGCYDHDSLEDLDIASGIIFDVENDQYKLSFIKTANTKSESSENSATYEVQTGLGSSIGKALENASQKAERSIFLGHVKLVFLTEEFAKDSRKMHYFFEYVHRNSYFNFSSSIYILLDDTTKIAKKIEDDDKQFNKLINNILWKNPNNNFLTTRLYKVAKNDGTFTLPTIGYREKNESNGDENLINNDSDTTLDSQDIITASASKEEEKSSDKKEKEEEIYFQGFAAIKDYKLSALYDNKQSQIYQLIITEGKDFYYPSKFCEIMILKSKSKLTKYEGLDFLLKVTIECEISNYYMNQSIDDFIINDIKTYYENYFTNEIKDLITNFREKDYVDALNIDLYLHRYHRDFYKDYIYKNNIDAFLESDIDVAVEIKITKAGIMR